MKSLTMKALLPGLSLLALWVLVFAQSPSIQWETLRPDTDGFSVQMPKGSTAQVTKEPYHKFELNISTYISQQANAPLFAVVSMSGIKSNPALYTEAERLNSYVDAFKNLFPPKIRGKEAVAKLALVGDKVLAGNTGREYRLTIADLSGVVQTYVTRKRFYAIAFLYTKKDEKLQDEFLSSFQIPEKGAAPTTTAAASPSPTESATATPSGNNSNASNPDAAEADPSASPIADTAELPRARKRGPVAGGILNGKALSLPAPDYPAAAKDAGAVGTVVVRVTIDEQGNVISAIAVSGPPMLQQSSVNAALQAKFSPTILVGEPVQVVGVLTYNFVRN